MFQTVHRRPGHYALLLLVWAALCLPNLGAPSLWDVDEGNNAGCSLEMRESGNWIVPTFNYRLREDKPPLLYWLQIAAYAVFGVNEFAARLPSALAALATVLGTYELGRAMFGKAVGLLAGVVLVTAVAFCGAAHFANPDGLLNACALFTFYFFYRDYPHGGRNWFLLTGITSGVAVLAKGPVGLVLPVAVHGLFLLWERQLRRLIDWRLLPAVLAFLVVAAPWYVWVGLETKGQWLFGFWSKHNQGRFLASMENHSGPVFYYLVVVIAGLAPWSVFLALTAWYSRRGPRTAEGEPPSSIRFLVCWIAVYFVFFTAARTKLPNYVLPLYPAVALLLARFLVHWQRGLVQPPAWLLQVSLGCMALMGAGVTLGLLIAGGVLPLSSVKGRSLPGLGAWSGLGGVLVLGAVVGRLCLRRQARAGVVGAVATSAVLFTGAAAVWGIGAVEGSKAPRRLVQALPADQTRREVRVAAYGYFQPSLVFYCQREVLLLDAEPQVLDFLRTPLPCYLFVAAEQWEALEPKVIGPHRILGRRYDLYDGHDVIVVANEPGRRALAAAR
jgi:4-amino-4-deoxy-L-arabinose transferase-like glycosyltransferase